MRCSKWSGPERHYTRRQATKPSPQIGLSPSVVCHFIMNAMPDESRLCDECRAIRAELVEAYATEWPLMDQASRDAASAVRAMLGGTEEDFQQAAKLTSGVKRREPGPKIKAVLLKAFKHGRHRAPDSSSPAYVGSCRFFSRPSADKTQSLGFGCAACPMNFSEGAMRCCE